MVSMKGRFPLMMPLMMMRARKGTNINLGHGHPLLTQELDLQELDIPEGLLLMLLPFHLLDYYGYLDQLHVGQ